MESSFIQQDVEILFNDMSMLVGHLVLSVNGGKRDRKASRGEKRENDDGLVFYVPFNIISVISQ